MNEIVNILMERDNIDREEAVDLYKEVCSMIQEAFKSGMSYSEVENILLDELSLEIAYLFAFI